MNWWYVGALVVFGGFLVLGGIMAWTLTHQDPEDFN